MRLLTDDKEDFSQDAYVVMATMLWALRAAERMGSRMADAMKAIGWNRTFFQAKKRHYKEAVRNCEAMLQHLELALNDSISRMYEKAAAENDTRYLSKATQDMTDAAACLLIMYYAKANENQVAATNMLKAIANFKTTTQDIHVDELLEYFHFKHLIQ